MQVILGEDVMGLGKMGDTVSVASGYARNFLFPRRLAIEASTKNVKKVEHEKRIIDGKIKKVKSAAEETAKKLGNLVLTFEVRAGEEGKLFGSVTNKDVQEKIAASGFGDLDKRKIMLDKPIKETGTYFVQVKVQHDVTASVKVEVVSVAGEAESEAEAE